MLSLEATELQLTVYRGSPHELRGSLARFGMGTDVPLPVWAVDIPDFVSILVSTDMVHRVYSYSARQSHWSV